MIEYEQELTIDPTMLDVELIEQPNLFMKYAEEAAHARAEMDRAKEHLDVVKAELDGQIRANPDEFGVGKITEAVVSNTILLQEEYKQASEDFISKKEEYGILSAAVSAFDQRKHSLSNLVELARLNYFAMPKEARDIAYEYSNHKRKQEVVRQKAKEKVKLSKPKGKRTK